MRGNYFLGNGKFETREMTFPAPAPHQVFIRNKVAGICGTDVHIYHGEKGSAEVTPPVVLGHEYSGIVEAVGEGVTAVSVGDCVTVDPNIYCGKCYHCRKGHKQYCENMVAIGVNMNGGFADYSLVPETQVFKMNPEVGFEAMAMAEPLACCVHGIEQVNIQSGDLVAVIGGGAIGLLMVQLAKLRGAGRVVLSEPVEARRKVGLQVGADYAIDPLAENPLKQIQALTGRDGVDVAIECVGKTFATKQAFDIADRGARLLLFSVPSVDATFDMPMFEVYKKELKIYGSFINPDSHQEAVDLINAGRIQTKPLITHFYPVEKLEEGIHMQ
ncbi:MAG: zinc-dependent alcohol dehydrogenase family protein, partial [Clostridia bacterium]|nr:zinc-dependent alcohol dehydrogenase family protein [Clostridia bacterium]